MCPTDRVSYAMRSRFPLRLNLQRHRDANDARNRPLATSTQSAAADQIIAIASAARYTDSRLLAGALSLTLFVYVLVNGAMVSGLLPVVGVPLPLVSFGGTSMVTLMAGFGILMSIQSNRKLLPH